jgi:gliding motility-associated-like protein
MQQRITYPFYLLLCLTLFPVLNLAGQGRHQVLPNSERAYRVTRQPDVLSYTWGVYTDAQFTKPATAQQAEIILQGEGRENEVKVKWLAEGDYYLMVSALGSNGCPNRKAWPFTVQPPANLLASVYCNEGKPWIRWDATAKGFNLNTIDLRLFDLNGKLVLEQLKTTLSGSMPWPEGSSKEKAMPPAELATLSLNAIFNELPNSDTLTVKLNYIDCNTDIVLAVNDTLSVFHASTDTLTILNNDYTSRGTLDSSSIVLVYDVSYGTLIIDKKTGKAIYTPDECFFGTDSFVYRVSNSSGITSNQATVYLKIEIDPNADSDDDGIPDIAEFLVDSGNLCDTDTDMDGLPNFLDPDDDNDGIKTSDELGDLNQNGIPDYLENWRSKAVDDTKETGIDIPVWISVLDNDSTTMVPATLHIVVNPSKGYVNVDRINRGVNYIPDNDFLGEDSFLYVVCDHQDVCDTALVVVNVIDYVIPPQLFTPNADGYNDQYIIKGIESYPENHFIVFNRWGNKVYEKENYANEWDGTSNSRYKIGDKPLPVGVYYYLLKYSKNQIKQGGLYLER